MRHITINGIPYCKCRDLKPDYYDWKKYPWEATKPCCYEAVDEEIYGFANYLCVEHRYKKIDIVDGPCPFCYAVEYDMKEENR
jgi:hypothetical protein